LHTRILRASVRHPGCVRGPDCATATEAGLSYRGLARASVAGPPDKGSLSRFPFSSVPGMDAPPLVQPAIRRSSPLCGVRWTGSRTSCGKTTAPTAVYL